MKRIYLCYERNNIVFIANIDELEINKMRTKKLLGAHKTSIRVSVDIVDSDNIALVTQDVHRMYRVPDADFRIHLDPCISTDMDWKGILPTSRDMNVIIYFEDNPNG